MNFPLNNFKDMNEVTFREFIKELKKEILAEVIVDLPIASTNALGCVKVGSGLAITDGVLSNTTDLSALQTKTLTTPVTIGGIEYTTVETAIAALAAL